MSDDDDHRSAHSVARGVGGVVAAVILMNLLVRVVPLPEVDLPSIALPDLPAWLHTVLNVKNWVLDGVVVVVIILGLSGGRGT